MALRDSNDNIAELLKAACPPAAASPEFKAKLRLQVNQQAAALGAATPKPLWKQPFVWIPAAAASAVAVALVILFVAIQSIPPAMTTRPATGIQTTTATLNGRLNSLSGSESVEVSFEWGTTTDYGNETIPELRTQTGDIIASLSGLTPDTTYHYRLKVVGREGAKYGPDRQFTTGPAPPVVTTSDAANIKTTSATLRGSLDDLGSAANVSVSFEWGPTTSYGSETTPESKTETGKFSADLSGLAPNTTYHFRAKAVGDDIAYGADAQFTTGTVPPSVETDDATTVASTSATLNGDLVSLGTASSVNVSFEWGLATGSYTHSVADQARNTTGAFSAELSGLTPGTTYYFRVKADGDGDPIYGPEKSFTTPTIPPSVATGDASSVDTVSAILNGDLISLGTAGNVTVSFEWGTASGSYIHTTADQLRTATGAFSANLSGLTPRTTYYYRAVADGDGDPVHGLEKSFTTLTTPPSVTTSDATGIGATSATLNGVLTSLGTAGSVTVSFEWGTASGSYTHTTAEQARSGTGAFSADLSGLDPGATYYFRARADGEGDPVYGEEKSFTALTVPPSVRTSSATEVRCTSAKLNGILDSLGTAESAEVSFEWGMTAAYGNETASEVLTAPGSFDAALTGLLPNTTYHFRAKAIGDGVAYGADMMFTTGRSLPPQTTWYLSADNSNGQRTMYESDAPREEGEVTVLAGRPVLWIADQPSGDSTYPASTWTVCLALSHLGGKHEVIVEIGVLDEAGFHGYGTYAFLAQGDNTATVHHYEALVPVVAFAVPSGGYVALRVDVNPKYCSRIDVHVGGSQSHVTSPAYPDQTAPEVTTSAATSVEQTTSILNGYLDSLGTAGSVTVCFQWGTTTEYGNETAPQSETEIGSFSASLAGITPNTTYHFRAKVVGDGANYGIDMTFTTPP